MRTSLKRYNIAFLPENQENFIKLSKKYNIKADYILGNNSLPHISIAQFFTENQYILTKIWEKSKFLLSSNLSKKIVLNKAAYKPENDNIWLELRVQYPEVCNTLHIEIKNILNQDTIEVINSPFIPHLTIARIKNNDKVINNLINNFMNDNFYFNNNFNLALGESDKIGQLIKLLYV